ncbi:MAG: tetratricopeptide repeat protein [Bacteroidetes bacterium]|nr:tetratricopeptide repeat protein [Bacteroidota bacterium]
MDRYFRIEEFIDGNLSQEESMRLKNELETNSDLAFELILRSEINKAIRDKNLMEFRDLILDQTHHQSSASALFNLQRDVLRTWHLAAASFILILVVGGLWFILSNKPFSTERLVSKYYKPAQSILQYRSLELNSDDALKEAFNFYQQNDYTIALKYFNSLENQITAKFYSGICYIELEQFDNAVKSFEFVINDKDNLFVEQAEWYLGLIYLMNNQKSQAIDQFNKIAKSDSFYEVQAKEILKYLN